MSLVPSPLVLVAAGCAVLTWAATVAGLAALRRRRWTGTAAAGLLGSLFFVLAALAATLAAATQGYHALTHEVVAARVVTRPAGPQQFTATFTFPDGRQASFALAGDGLYVDAHIVKWHPLANLLGLHTAYQLDRVGGRYHRLEDERRLPRRVFALSAERAVDLFRLAGALKRLGPLVDAEYGSAAFVPAGQPAELELRVSTSGLLFRPVRTASRAPA